MLRHMPPGRTNENGGRHEAGRRRNIDAADQASLDTSLTTLEKSSLPLPAQLFIA